jgi:hypothetical protein
MLTLIPSLLVGLSCAFSLPGAAEARTLHERDQHRQQEQRQVHAREEDERRRPAAAGGDAACALADPVALAQRQRAAEARHRNAELAQRRFEPAVLIRGADEQDLVGPEIAQRVLDGLATSPPSPWGSPKVNTL